ncbi:MAG TPA: VOC family protein [Solirubrobacteraceae bacterium]|nr:VOC family protein [Solirubrobacteraceae bacterium]
MSERDSYPAGVPCWVDNLVPDPQKSIAFYRELFGWEFDGPGPGDYYVAKLRGRDVAGLAQAPPGVSPGWNTYVSVTSADDTARAAGRVVLEPFDVLPAGRVAALADPAGAVIGVWQPGERLGCQLVNEASAYAMSALHTPDPDAAARYYRDIFGWDIEEFAPGASLFRLPGYVGGEPAQPVPRDVVAVLARDEGPARWSVDFWVEDADAAAARAPELGGSVVVAPFDSVPKRQAVLADPDGAVFSVSTAAGKFGS